MWLEQRELCLAGLTRSPQGLNQTSHPRGRGTKNSPVLSAPAHLLNLTMAFGTISIRGWAILYWGPYWALEGGAEQLPWSPPTRCQEDPPVMMTTDVPTHC